MPARLSDSTVRNLIGKLIKNNEMIEKILELLLWYGVLGLLREDGEVTYIYTVKIRHQTSKALIQKRTGSEPIYYVNPAFWKGLEIRSG